MTTGIDITSFPLLLAAAGGDDHGFTWWGLAGFGDVPHYLIMGPVVCVALCLVALAVNVSLRKGDPVVPQDPAGMGFLDWIRAGFEGLVEQAVELVDGLMPHHHQGRRYLWLIGPLFLYILVGNLTGLVPGMLPPTDSLNTNMAVALVVFLAYNIYGISEVGFGYLRHFWAPAGLGAMGLAVGPLLLLIEIFGHGFRPITLSLRLFANMTGDHTAFAIVSGLAPFVIPMAIMALGLIVSLVQAYVFTLLTSIYIMLATSHEH